ncbi:hypothetical protein [Streptomyces sp. RG80]
MARCAATDDDEHRVRLRGEDGRVGEGLQRGAVQHDEVRVRLQGA